MSELRGAFLIFLEDLVVVGLLDWVDAERVGDVAEEGGWFLAH